MVTHALYEGPLVRVPCPISRVQHSLKLTRCGVSGSWSWYGVYPDHGLDVVYPDHGFDRNMSSPSFRLIFQPLLNLYSRSVKLSIYGWSIFVYSRYSETSTTRFPGLCLAWLSGANITAYSLTQQYQCHRRVFCLLLWGMKTVFKNNFAHE